MKPTSETPTTSSIEPQKSRARKSINAVAPNKESTFKAQQALSAPGPSSSRERTGNEGPIYRRIYDCHKVISAETVLQPIDPELLIRIVQSIAELPEKVLLPSSSSESSRKPFNDDHGKEAKHKEKRKEREKASHMQPRHTRRSDSEDRMSTTSDTREKEDKRRNKKLEKERVKQKEATSLHLVEYPSVENASAVPDAELFHKFDFSPLQLVVSELEPDVIEGGFFYSTLPLKRKLPRARSRSSSSERSESVSNSDTRDSSKMSASKKKPVSVVVTESKCHVCGAVLSDDTSAYCSEKCMAEIVSKATKAFSSMDEGVSIVSASGGLHSCRPAVSELLDFLRAYPTYVPIIPAKVVTSKEKQPVTKKPQEEPAKDKALKPLTKESDAIRFNVRQSLFKELSQSMRTTNNTSEFQTGKGKQLVEQLEMHLFKKCEMNVRDNRYKEFIKNLIMCFREGKNEVSMRLLNGSLTVQKLASIEPDLLKSDEFLASLRPPADVEILEVSDTGHAPESAATATTSSVLSESAEEPTTSKQPQTPLFTLKTSIPGLGYAIPKKKAPVPKHSNQSNALDAILGDGKKDTTAQHLSHLYDVNCSICATRQKSKTDADLKEKEDKERTRKEMKRKRQELRLSDRPDFGARNRNDYRIDRDDDGFDDDYGAAPFGGRASPDKWNEADENRGSRRWEDSGRAQEDSWRHSENWRRNEEEDEDLRRGRGEERNRDRDERSGQIGSSRETSRKTGKGQLSRQTLEQMFINPIIWRGQIVFNGVAFVSSLVALSSSSCFELDSQLPVSLKITGRIAPIVVFDYFTSIRFNKMYSIALYNIEQPMDDEGSRRFFNLYMDMLNKDRNFVIEVPCPLVREAYLLPLQPGQDPPAYLLPFEGPGISAGHSCMILCIMTLDTDPNDMDEEVGQKVRTAVEGRVSRLSNDSPRVDVPRQDSPLVIAPVLAAPHAVSTATTPIDLSAADEPLKRTPQESEHPSSVQATVPPVSAPLPVSSTTQPKNDDLLPANFFDRFKEKEKELTDSNTAAGVLANSSSAVPMDPNSVHTLEDLLLYIELTESPKLIKDVVARFIANESIPQEQKELIRTRVVNKITAAKNKRKMKEGKNQTNEERKQVVAVTTGREEGNDFQPSDEFSSFASVSNLTALNEARNRLNGTSDSASRTPIEGGDLSNEKPSESSRVPEHSAALRGPRTPESEFGDRQSTLSHTASPSHAVLNAGTSETAFPPLPTIPPPPSNRTMPVLPPYGMPPPLGMLPPNFYAAPPSSFSGPPPAFPPPPVSSGQEAIPASSFLALQQQSRPDRHSIIDFFNTAGGFKPASEVAPIPAELFHSRLTSNGGVVPGFGRKADRSPSPPSRIQSRAAPSPPSSSDGPSFVNRPPMRLGCVGGVWVMPGAKPRPSPRPPTPDPFELVRQQVIEERDRKRRKEQDEKDRIREERSKLREEQRKEREERRKKRKEDFEASLDSLPGPIKLQRGLWKNDNEDEKDTDELKNQNNYQPDWQKGIAQAGDESEPPPKKKRNRQGKGSREKKRLWRAMEATEKEKNNEEMEAPEETEAEVEMETAATTSAAAVTAASPEEQAQTAAAAPPARESNYDDFNDDDIAMSFERPPPAKKAKKQQQQQQQQQQQKQTKAQPLFSQQAPLQHGRAAQNMQGGFQQGKKRGQGMGHGQGRGQQRGGRGQKQDYDYNNSRGGNQKFGEQGRGAAQSDAWKKNRPNLRGVRCNQQSYSNYDDYNGGYDDYNEDWGDEGYYNQYDDYETGSGYKHQQRGGGKNRRGGKGASGGYTDNWNNDDAWTEEPYDTWNESSGSGWNDEFDYDYGQQQPSKKRRGGRNRNGGGGERAAASAEWGDGDAADDFDGDWNVQQSSFNHNKGNNRQFSQGRMPPQQQGMPPPLGKPRPLFEIDIASGSPQTPPPVPLPHLPVPFPTLNASKQFPGSSKGHTPSKAPVPGPVPTPFHLTPSAATVPLPRPASPLISFLPPPPVPPAVLQMTAKSIKEPSIPPPPPSFVPPPPPAPK